MVAIFIIGACLGAGIGFVLAALLIGAKQERTEHDIYVEGYIAGRVERDNKTIVL